VRGNSEDFTLQNRQDLPILVFLDQYQPSRNVALCGSRWRILSNDGHLVEL